jgi:hypothetical protein
VVVVIAAVVAVFLVRGGDDQPSAGGCRLVTPPSGAPTGPGAGVTVVEHGHTRIPSADTVVSMGAVLQNTTGKVAYRTRVTFDVLDGAGTSVVWENQRNFMIQEVAVILPGAKVTVGDALALTQSARQDPGKVARVAITAVVSRWLDPGDGNDGLGAIATKVVPGQGQRDAAGSGSVSFTTTNANCAPMVSRGTSMIFRDAAGKVVGGSLSTTPAATACRPGAGTTPDVARASLRSIPETADLDKTDVTAYCDFTRPPRSTELGAPIN